MEPIVTLGIEIESFCPDPYSFCDNCDRCVSCNPWFQICERCDQEEVCERICFPEQNINSLPCFEEPDLSCEDCEYLFEGCLLCINRNILCRSKRKSHKNFLCAGCSSFETDYFCLFRPKCEEFDEICSRCEEDGRIVNNYCADCPICEGCDIGDRIIESIEDEIPDHELFHRIYWDGSCGPEIVSKPSEIIDNLTHFYQIESPALEELGFICDHHRCGGHITAGIRDRLNGKLIDLIETNIFKNVFTLVYSYLPVLICYSCKEDTWRRGYFYREFLFICSEDFNEDPDLKKWEKHQCLRMKSNYLIEFRFFDSCKSQQLKRNLLLVKGIMEYCYNLSNVILPKPEEIELSANLSEKIMKTRDGYSEVINDERFLELKKKFFDKFSSCLSLSFLF